ncbi:MAG TPA: hypothetical protein VN230_05160 [Burkholderiaceae bacterium]|nr:hypothetical protein [Burkholderiaceae bacterium]
MIRNFNPRGAALGALAASLLLGAATLPARAQDELILLETARATTYVNGGVGKEEEAQMRKMAKDWPLRMMFSERKDNEFVADVNLFVTDHRGGPVLALNNAGPMTYAMLPAGKYRITAAFRGITESREVTLDGKQGKDVYFHWKGKPKLDPWDGKPVGGKQVPG